MSENTESITLYGFPTSPYVVKVAAYLGYKKLDYEFVGVNPVNFEQVAFTNRRQVPVLKIGKEWKQDSDDIALWLEELYPQYPLLPEKEHELAKVHQLNDWVNDTVIRSIFRLTVDWPSVPIGVSNGWKLSKAVNQSVGIPKWVQVLWPVLLLRARFIRRIIEPLDRTESLENSQLRVLNQFTGFCNGGPFLGGRTEPSLADVSLYPLILLGNVLGLKGDIPWQDRSEAQAWTHRMGEFFNDPPLPSVSQSPSSGLA